MENENLRAPDENEEIEKLAEMIQQSFPAETYLGKITPEDGQLDDANLDEQRELFKGLKGRKWPDVEQRLLQSHPDGYVLLTDQAFPVFIAAWLERSLENIQGDNQIRDFIVYAFAPKQDQVPDTTESVRRRLRSLNRPQLHVLRSILVTFARRDPSPFQKALAVKAVKLIDGLD